LLLHFNLPLGLCRMIEMMKTFCTLLLLYPSAHCLVPSFFSNVQRGANICTTYNDDQFALHKTAGRTHAANVKNSNGMIKHKIKSEKAYSGGSMIKNDEYKWKVECHEISEENSYAIVVIRKIRPRSNLKAKQSVLTRSEDNTIVSLPKDDVFNGESYQDRAKWFMKPSDEDGVLNWQKGVTFENRDESNQFLDIEPNGKKGALKTSETGRKWDIICDPSQNGRYDKEAMKEKFQKAGVFSVTISAATAGLAALIFPVVGLPFVAAGLGIAAPIFNKIEKELGTTIPNVQKVAIDFSPGEYKWMVDKREAE